MVKSKRTGMVGYSYRFVHPGASAATFVLSLGDMGASVYQAFEGLPPPGSGPLAPATVAVGEYNAPVLVEEALRAPEMPHTFLNAGGASEPAWKGHEESVAEGRKAANPAAAEQVTLEVIRKSTGEKIRVRPDVLEPTRPNTFQISEAKYSEAKDLTTADLSSTLTKNQAKLAEWLSKPANLIVTPRGANAENACLVPGRPVRLEPKLNVW